MSLQNKLHNQKQVSRKIWVVGASSGKESQGENAQKKRFGWHARKTHFSPFGFQNE